MTASIARRLRRTAASLPDEGLSIRAMAQAHGPQAPGTLLLLMAAPCLLPVPGVGTVLGMGLAALAWALWRTDSGNALPQRVAGLELSATWTRRVLMFLVRTYLVASRYSHARFSRFAASPDQFWVVATIAAMAVLMVLPIPFGNVLPALSVMLVGLGLVFRDGLAMILGVLTAVVAMAATGLMVLVAWDLGTGWIAQALS